MAGAAGWGSPEAGGGCVWPEVSSSGSSQSLAGAVSPLLHVWVLYLGHSSSSLIKCHLSRKAVLESSLQSVVFSRSAHAFQWNAHLSLGPLLTWLMVHPRGRWLGPLLPRTGPLPNAWRHVTPIHLSQTPCWFLQNAPYSFLV